MVKGVVIFIEGDSKQKGKYNSISLREGFQHFFSPLSEKARSKGIKFRSIPCNSKFLTFKDFLNGLKVYQDSFIIFLVDSDEEVSDNETAKTFLRKQNPNWHLNEVDEEQCHLMIQVMESWFLADPEVLQGFYGHHFNSNAIPRHADIEKVPKGDVEEAFKRATQNTTKGTYHKVKHGAELLRKIDPQKVKAKAKYCQRLFDVIEEKINQNNEH